MVKSKQAEILKSLKLNTNGNSFKNLVAYLEFKLAAIHRQWPTATGDELIKLQGRALELTEFLAALRRQPVKDQSTGAFN